MSFGSARRSRTERRGRAAALATLVAFTAALGAAAPAQAVLLGETPVELADGALARINTIAIGSQVRTPSGSSAVVVFSQGTRSAPWEPLLTLFAAETWLTATPDQPLMTPAGPVRAQDLRVGTTVQTSDGTAPVRSVVSGIENAQLQRLGLTSIAPAKQVAGHTFLAAGFIVGDFPLQLALATADPQPGAALATRAVLEGAAAGNRAGAVRRARDRRLRSVSMHPRSQDRLEDRGTCIRGTLAGFERHRAGDGARALATIRSRCAPVGTVRLADQVRVASRVRVTFHLACPARYRVDAAWIRRPAPGVRELRRSRLDDRTVRLTVVGGRTARQVAARARCTAPVE